MTASFEMENTCTIQFNTLEVTRRLLILRPKSACYGYGLSGLASGGVFVSCFSERKNLSATFHPALTPIDVR
jgi:hypothetical protein